MIYNANKIFGTVWKVDIAENGKYMDLQMTTSEKGTDGNYINSSWFPRAIGHALNSLKGLKRGDRIVITKSKFTNERYSDKSGNPKSHFKFLILEASIENGNAYTESAANSASKPDDVPVSVAEQETDDTCPW